MSGSFGCGLFCILAVGLAGCARTPSRSTATRPPTTPLTVRTNPPLERFAQQLRGRVDLVNPKGQYVIISFPIGSMAPLDSRLNIYRNNVKVAEVKVGMPQHDNLTAAVIVSGECQVGDEARAE